MWGSSDRYGPNLLAEAVAAATSEAEAVAAAASEAEAVSAAASEA